MKKMKLTLRMTMMAAACLTLSACGQQKKAADSTPGDAATPANETAPADHAATEWTGASDEAAFKAMHAPPADGSTVTLKGSMIDLAGGKAYLSLPAGDGPHPGLVVIQEWWGLNDHIKHWADRLAADGYAAIAVDLYAGQIASDSDQAYKLMTSVDATRASEILSAAHAFLTSDPRIAAPKTGSIGWCFGGGWSLRLAIAEPNLDACVLYYGHLVDNPAELAKIKAPVCGIFANKDESIPPATVDAFDKALTDAGVPHEIHRYEASHAFANPSNPIYDETNSALAREVTRAFLAKHLKS